MELGGGGSGNRHKVVVVETCRQGCSRRGEAETLRRSHPSVAGSVRVRFVGHGWYLGILVGDR